MALPRAENSQCPFKHHARFLAESGYGVLIHDMKGVLLKCCRIFGARLSEPLQVPGFEIPRYFEGVSHLRQLLRVRDPRSICLSNTPWISNFNN
jgi:hypothetical protein